MAWSGWGLIEARRQGGRGDEHGGRAGLGEVAPVGGLPFVVGFNEHGSGEPAVAGRVGMMPGMSVRRLISLFNRSCGLVDQSFFQLATTETGWQVATLWRCAPAVGRQRPRCPCGRRRRSATVIRSTGKRR